MRAHLELEDCVLVTRQGALDPIGVFLVLKREGHFCGFHVLAQVDHITALAARLPEQTPRDRIEQRGFTRTVLPGNTGKIEPSEINLHCVVIREKTRDTEVKRDHMLNCTLYCTFVL